jgi:hypothetical protein
MRLPCCFVDMTTMSSLYTHRTGPIAGPRSTTRLRDGMTFVCTRFPNDLSAANFAGCSCSPNISNLFNTTSAGRELRIHTTIAGGSYVTS